MAGWMPILRQYDVREPLGQPIDRRNDLIAARNRETAPGTEVVLHVDDQQNVLVADRHTPDHVGTLACAKRLSTSFASRSRASAT